MDKSLINRVLLLLLESLLYLLDKSCCLISAALDDEELSESQNFKSFIFVVYKSVAQSNVKSISPLSSTVSVH